MRRMILVGQKNDLNSDNWKIKGLKLAFAQRDCQWKRQGFWSENDFKYSNQRQLPSAEMYAVEL